MQVLGNKVLVHLNEEKESITKGGIHLKEEKSVKTHGTITMTGTGDWVKKELRIGDEIVFHEGDAIEIPGIGHIVKMESILAIIGDK